MIIQASDCSQASRTVQRRAARPDFSDRISDDLDDDCAGDAADTLRMIELSGMLGLQSGMLDAE